jgi:hypothetical protein
VVCGRVFRRIVRLSSHFIGLVAAIIVATRTGQFKTDVVRE